MKWNLKTFHKKPFWRIILRRVKKILRYLVISQSRDFIFKWIKIGRLPSKLQTLKTFVTSQQTRNVKFLRQATHSQPRTLPSHHEWKNINLNFALNLVRSSRNLHSIKSNVLGCEFNWKSFEDSTVTLKIRIYCRSFKVTKPVMEFVEAYDRSRLRNGFLRL